MLIRTVTELPCTADAAWAAVHRPAVAAELYAPLLVMRADGGLPPRFDAGDHLTVRLMLLDRLSLGSQLIAIADQVPAGVVSAGSVPSRVAPQSRAMQDHGRPLSGPLARLTRWQHQMTISAAPGRPDRAIWRDELSIAGGAAAVFGPVLAVMWQVRRWKIRRLARSWDDAHTDHVREDDALAGDEAKAQPEQ